MYKLYLVEDEVVVRESIKKNVNWEACGFSLVGEAGDGEIAYAQIRELLPDLVITDIRMPFMDGMELSRLLRGEFPDIKIVLLTGHGEFEYAQQAIRLGAAEYLLKPVTMEVLSQTLERMYQMLEQERRQKNLLAHYQADMLETKQSERQRFFDQLVQGKRPVNELLALAQKLELDIAAFGYAVILFHIFAAERDEVAYSEELVRYQEWLEGPFLAATNAMLFRNGPNSSALLVKLEHVDGADEVCGGLARQLALRGERENLHYFIACGQAAGRLGDIKNAYATANKAYSYRYIMQGDNVVFYSQLRGRAPQTQDYPDLATLTAGSIDKSIIERLLRTGAVADARPVVEEIFRNIGEAHLASWMLRQYLVMDSQIACLSYLEELGIGKQKLLQACGSTQALAEKLHTVASARQHMVALLETTLHLREAHTQGRYSSMIRTAKAYIEENYTRDDISLQAVAKAVNVSPTHFSTLFRQESGQTFIEFLTQVRMEKAKELLRATAEKTSEIAYAVGYKDPHYFSYLFKKVNGCSPTEFRSR